MKKILSLLIVLALFPALALSQEKKISKKQVPSAVLTAFHNAYPNAKVKQYNKEMDEGKLYYEVESKEGKSSRDVLYTPEGTVAEVEEQVSNDNLPAPVKDAVSKNYSGMKISRIEKTTKGSNVTYEILFKGKKQKKEVVFSPEGNIVKG